MPAKFCSKCGTAIQPGTKFCARCGAPVQADAAPPPAAQPVYGQPPPNPYAQTQTAYAPAPKKRGGKTALIVVGCIVGFLALIIIIAVVIANAALGNAADADYYKMGNDQITSIKAVVGARTVTRMESASSGGVTTQTIGYSGVQSVQDDLMQYMAYLRNNDGFIVTEDYDLSVFPGTFQLAKASVDDGMLVILDVAYSENEYTLVFTKCVGTFEAN